MMITQQQRKSRITTQKMPKFKNSVIQDKVAALLMLRKMHKLSAELESEKITK